MIRSVGAGWQLEVSVAEVASRRPDTVRQLLDIQIDRLNSIEQRILEAASLVGVQFAAGSVGLARRRRLHYVLHERKTTSARTR